MLPGLASAPIVDVPGVNFVADITGDAVAELLLRPDLGLTRGCVVLQR